MMLVLIPVCLGCHLLTECPQPQMWAQSFQGQKRGPRRKGRRSGPCAAAAAAVGFPSQEVAAVDLHVSHLEGSKPRTPALHFPADRGWGHPQTAGLAPHLASLPGKHTCLMQGSTWQLPMPRVPFVTLSWASWPQGEEWPRPPLAPQRPRLCDWISQPSLSRKPSSWETCDSSAPARNRIVPSAWRETRFIS